MCSIWLCVEWKTNVGKVWPLTLWELAVKLIVGTGLNRGEAGSQCPPAPDRKRSSPMVKWEGVQCAGEQEPVSRMFLLLIFLKQLIAEFPPSAPHPIASPFPRFSEVTATLQEAYILPGAFFRHMFK